MGAVCAGMTGSMSSSTSTTTSATSTTTTSPTPANNKDPFGQWLQDIWWQNPSHKLEVALDASVAITGILGAFVISPTIALDFMTAGALANIIQALAIGQDPYEKISAVSSFLFMIISEWWAGLNVFQQVVAGITIGGINSIIIVGSESSSSLEGATLRGRIQRVEILFHAHPSRQKIR